MRAGLCFFANFFGQFCKFFFQLFFLQARCSKAFRIDGTLPVDVADLNGDLFQPSLDAHQLLRQRCQSFFMVFFMILLALALLSSGLF